MSCLCIPSRFQSRTESRSQIIFSKCLLVPDLVSIFNRNSIFFQTESYEHSALVGGAGGGGAGGGGSYAGGYGTGAGYGGSSNITNIHETTTVTNTMIGGGGGGGGAGTFSRGDAYGGGMSSSNYQMDQSNLAAGGYGGGNLLSTSSSFAGSAGTMGHGGLINIADSAAGVTTIAPEIRVESFTLTADCRSVITGSGSSAPQVWDMRVSHQYQLCLVSIPESQS
jgi:hypothetical protein